MATLDKNFPVINWIKNDPIEHSCFTDGSVFLVAIEVMNKESKTTLWEFDVIEIYCDDDGATLYYRGQSEIYDSWEWNDFSYFHLLDGEMPTAL